MTVKVLARAAVKERFASFGAELVCGKFSVFLIHSLGPNEQTQTISGYTLTSTKQPHELLDDPGQLFLPPPTHFAAGLHIRSICGTLYP